ncbi:MAG: DUF5009 domain-containing protein [Bacteroidaceae bacterium]|nr:DUF5009 domain-containing protein [Bacteroidaceae bacterium]
MKEKNRRLLSLDALRGFDMFFIMGGGALLLSVSSFFPENVSAFIAEQMGHKEWHGFAFYDLIFPLFLFLAGLSLPFSLSKQLSLGKSRLNISLKIVRRAVLLVFLGVLYNGLLNFDFENLRYASVLGRIGLAWAIAALIYLWAGKRVSVVVSVVVLLGYWALLALVKAPDALPEVAVYSMEGSIVGYVDRLYLPGVLHLGVHDPEGLLSTLPAVVTAMAGIFTGDFVRQKRVKEYSKVGIMLLTSLLLLVLGYLWGLAFPINKNLWTSSFVVFAAGWSLLLFALFYLVIDVVGLKRWSFFFRVIGMNSITIYLLQQFFDFHKPVQTLFAGLISLFPDMYYPSLYWCCYVLICWLLLYFLYRKGVFLKV